MFGGNPHPVPPLELQQLQFQQAAGDVAMADAVNDGDQEEANE